MKRKMFAMLMILCILVGGLTACSKKNDSASQTNVTKKVSQEVDLNGKYTVKDPKGVEFDTRSTLYKPYIQSDEKYADGARYTFVVIYAKKGKGEYMYSVDIFETEKQAVASKEKDGKGTVDGKAVVVTSDEAFFKKMESFVPKAEDWVNNLKASGLMPIENK